MSLVESLIKIESQVHKGNVLENTKNFYKFVEIYEKEINNIFLILINNFYEIKNEMKSEINNEINFIATLNINFNEKIKNETEYMVLVVSMMIIKAFSNAKLVDSGDGKNNKYIYESDSIINSVLHDINFFFTWIEIYINKYAFEKITLMFDFKEKRKFLFKIFMILEKYKQIIIKAKRIKKKTLNFYLLDIEYKNFIFLNMFKNEFNVYKKNEEHIYIYINHYSNVFQVLRGNIYSGAKFKINIDSSFINNVLRVKAKIDYNILNYFFEKKIKKLNYETKHLYKYFNEISSEIRKAMINDDYNTLEVLSKKFSEILDLLRIYEILNTKEDVFYYFPIILCFRGRTYFTSSISFTFYKELRYCLYLGDYDENFVQNFHRLNPKIEAIFDKFRKKLAFIKKYDFTKKNKNIQIAVLWVLISIAEIDKKRLGEEITLEQFINNAISIVNNEKKLNDLDEYDDLKLYSLNTILTEIDKNIFKQRLLSKDATASCFQHLIKILGCETKEALKWCNLTSLSTWYDTYIYILNKWKKRVFTNLSLEEKIFINKYFTRNNIKKTTMTLQYGAKFKTCWEYFCSNIDLNSLTDVELLKLKNYFKNYYEFISENIGLLDKNPQEIINALKQVNYICELENNSKVDLTYKKKIKKQMKILLDKKRYTKLDSVIDEKNLDFKKIKNSTRANYIHVHDAAVVRYVMSKLPILTIHDCFMIDYLSVTFLIAIVNDAMTMSFHDLKLNDNFDLKDIFSIFIII